MDFRDRADISRCAIKMDSRRSDNKVDESSLDCALERLSVVFEVELFAIKMDSRNSVINVYDQSRVHLNRDTNVSTRDIPIEPSSRNYKHSVFGFVAFEECRALPLLITSNFIMRCVLTLTVLCGLKRGFKV